LAASAAWARRQALEDAVGPVRPGPDADGLLDAEFLDGGDELLVRLGVVLSRVALVAHQQCRVEFDDLRRGLLVFVALVGRGRDGGGDAAPSPCLIGELAGPTPCITKIV
jgi:hypothetical protein